VDGDVVSFTQRRQKATSGAELVRVRDSEGMLPPMQDVLANRRAFGPLNEVERQDDYVQS
jgi:hypothetical protein